MTITAKIYCKQLPNDNLNLRINLPNIHFCLVHSVKIITLFKQYVYAMTYFKMSHLHTHRSILT